MHIQLARNVRFSLLHFAVGKLPGCLMQAVSVSVSIELLQAPEAACL